MGYSPEQVKNFMGIYDRLIRANEHAHSTGPDYAKKIDEGRMFLDILEEAQEIPKEVRDDRFNRHLENLEYIIVSKGYKC